MKNLERKNPRGLSNHNVWKAVLFMVVASSCPVTNLLATPGQNSLLSTTPNAMIGIYSRNVLAAEDQFRNKRFIVTGNIGNIGIKEGGSAYITFSGLITVNADLEDAVQSTASHLGPGDNVSLICTGTGYEEGLTLFGMAIRTPTMGHCSFFAINNMRASNYSEYEILKKKRDQEEVRKKARMRMIAQQKQREKIEHLVELARQSLTQAMPAQKLVENDLINNNYMINRCLAGFGTRDTENPWEKFCEKEFEIADYRGEIKDNNISIGDVAIVGDNWNYDRDEDEIVSGEDITDIVIDFNEKVDNWRAVLKPRIITDEKGEKRIVWSCDINARYHNPDPVEEFDNGPTLKGGKHYKCGDQYPDLPNTAVPPSISDVNPEQASTASTPPVIGSTDSQDTPLDPRYWYYCESSKTYYPYVSSCPEGWKEVTPSPSADVNTEQASNESRGPISRTFTAIHNWFSQ